jgi:hypothetical protein
MDPVVTDRGKLLNRSSACRGLRESIATCHPCRSRSISKQRALILPPSFPRERLESIHSRIAIKMTNPSMKLDNLGGGYNGIIYRIRATSDSSKEFVRSLSRFGDTPPLPERYRQESASCLGSLRPVSPLLKAFITSCSLPGRR